MSQQRARAWAILVGIVAAACTGAGCKRRAAAPDDEAEAAPVNVVCATARSETGSDSVTLRGVIAVPPERSALVSAAIAGRVTRLLVHEGDQVHAGQLLASIEDPALEAGTTEASALASAARSALTSADAARARAQRLFDQGIAPRRDVEDAVARQASARAELQAAQARQLLARRQQGRAQVTAPIAGLVLRLRTRIGELVDGSAATPIAELADTSVLELRADAPAADLVRLHQGDAVTVRLDALPGLALTGQLVFVAAALDSNTSLGLVRASIVRPAGQQLQLGLSGQLVAALAPRPRLLVPARAVRRSAVGGREVVVCKGGSAEVRTVEVGASQGDAVEITSGLAAGEQVVAQRVLGLEDGTAINSGAGSMPAPELSVPSPSPPASMPAPALSGPPPDAGSP